MSLGQYGNAVMIIETIMGGESAAVKGLRPLRGARAPLTLQYPGDSHQCTPRYEPTLNNGCGSDAI